MKDNHALVAIVSLVFTIIVVLSMASMWVGQKKAYNQCITYHKKLSVVEANSTCQKIIYGDEP